MDKQFMYLWVRRDLSTPQKIVQTAHASAAIGKRFHADTHIALMEAQDELDLQNISRYLDVHSIQHEVFFEPDLPGYTAIATEPLVGQRRKPLKHFSLMR